MRNKVRLVVIVILLTTVMMFSGCRLYTVVPMAEKKEDGLVASQQDADLDPKLYVEDVWDEITEFAVTNAYPINDVLGAYLTDRNECIAKYSASDVGEADTASFIVQGRVKIIDVNRDSKAGMMGIDVMPYDDVIDAYVQIGPVYKGNTVRDTIPFITFEDFKNQLAFGDIGKAINAQIDKIIVVPFDADSQIGQEIVITGIFPDGEGIVITPLDIETISEPSDEEIETVDDAVQ